MGIMEDVNILPQPNADEPGQLDLTLNVVERKTGGINLQSY
jgi:outer membrane protein assembly factor BamA